MSYNGITTNHELRELLSYEYKRKDKTYTMTTFTKPVTAVVSLFVVRQQSDTQAIKNGCEFDTLS